MRLSTLVVILGVTFGVAANVAASSPMYRDPMSRCRSERATAPVNMRHLLFSERPDLCRPHLEFDGSWIESGGPLLGLGASQRAGNEDAWSFYGTLGYEVAANEWLFAGLYAE